MIEVLTEETIHKKTPQELTRILYLVILERLNLATSAIKELKYDQVNTHLQKCNDLLYRLGAGINYEAGIIADQLEALYNYLADKVIEANIKKDIKVIEELISIITELSEAWDQAIEVNNSQITSVRIHKTNAYDKAYEAASVDIRE